MSGRGAAGSAGALGALGRRFESVALIDFSAISIHQKAII